MKKGTALIIGALAAGTVVGIATSPLILFVVLLLACPLLHMLGGHGHHGGQSHQHSSKANDEYGLALRGDREFIWTEKKDAHEGHR